MKALNIITLILLIVGGLNWGLMGLFQFDLVAALFAGPQSTLSRIVYTLVGLSAVYQLIPLTQTISNNNVSDTTAYGTSGRSVDNRL